MILGHPISKGFRRLTGCEQDPRDRGVTGAILYGALDRGTAPGIIYMAKSTSLSSRIPGNSSGNTYGNSLTTRIFSTST